MVASLNGVSMEVKPVCQWSSKCFTFHRVTPFHSNVPGTRQVISVTTMSDLPASFHIQRPQSRQLPKANHYPVLGSATKLILQLIMLCLPLSLHVLLLHPF